MTPASPELFFAKALEIIQDQNKILTEIRTGQALSNEIQRQLLDNAREQGAVIKQVQTDLDAHKKDAITWSGVGNSFVFAGKAIALTASILGVIWAGLNIGTRFGWL